MDVERDKVEQVLESLERIAKHVEEADDQGDRIVRHGFESHAAGIRTACKIIRTDLLGERVDWPAKVS